MISHITVLALEQMLGSSAANPVEMLEAARAVLKSERDVRAGFSIQLASPELSDLSVLGGFRIRPECTLADIDDTDLIVIPALWRKPAEALRRHKETVVPWLQRRYQRGASVVAVGTGVIFAAEAGILDGKAATTHWHYLDQLEKDYPKISLQRKHLLTQADRIYCAASVNSAADMMIHWLSLVFGRELAMKVEQQFSPEARRPFEQKVFHADLGRQHPDEAIARVQSWLQQNLTEQLDLPALATLAGLSSRQLSRRFRDVTGQTPGEYQQIIRCVVARDLLKNSDMPVAEVGQCVGYQDPSYFGRIFRRHNQQTPAEYRAKVRHKLFRT